MYSRRKKVRTGTKKVETLLRKFNKSRDSDGAGPRKSGQKWEWANKSLNIANSATGYLHFEGDSTEQLVLGNSAETPVGAADDVLNVDRQDFEWRAR